MARLSYDNPGVVRQGNVRHICVAVSRDGDYRIVRTPGVGQTQRLNGKMPTDEFRQLTKLLGAAEFRSLSGHVGLILQESERLADWLQGFQPKDADAKLHGLHPRALGRPTESPLQSSSRKPRYSQIARALR